LSQRFSFQQITKQFRNEDYYFFFAVLPSRSTAAGWYIDFSGFSASWVILTQDKFLNTTYVTADTTGTSKTPRPVTANRAGAFQKRKTSRDCIHGADI
jgi:hypothetical protein